MTDPIGRALLMAERMEALREKMSHVADLRANAVREALASGMSRTEVAAALGISKQALSLILKRQ